MPICEWCGKEFEESEATDEFEIECGLYSYANVQKCLCGACAIQAIEEQVDGVYFEVCEECGKTFDVIVDSSAFDQHFNYCNGTSLQDYWSEKILCSDCVLSSIDDDI